MTDGVSQLRLVVTVPDFDAALAFYRDELGLPEEASFSGDGTRVSILGAGRATLELADAGHAAFRGRGRGGTPGGRPGPGRVRGG